VRSNKKKWTSFLFSATTKQGDSRSCINFGAVCEEDRHKRYAKLFTVKEINK
jgi:hypothetical protein